MRCYGCMNEYSDEHEICPHCGYVKESKPEEAIQIETGSMLDNRYLIGKAIAYGGLGFTYISWDTQLNRKVAVKEYFPSEFATRVPGQTTVTVFSGDKTNQYNEGLDKFIDEARRLAKFKSEKGIVTIYDSFEENNTAYIIMEYLDGETLTQYLDREGKLTANQAISMLMPLMDSLTVAHEMGIIHGNITPDNIFITKTGDIKLIDFGISRYETSSSVIVKPGYSAEEQYRSRGEQCPHTDVYAFGGVLYKMMTGIAPPDALERRTQFESKSKDILTPVSKHTKDITANQETAIMNALSIRIEDRTPNITSLVSELLSKEPVARRNKKARLAPHYIWPLWLKIVVPVFVVMVSTLLVLLLTGVIRFSTSGEENLSNKTINGISSVSATLNKNSTTTNIPETKSEILDYYNERINAAYNSKVGFVKERTVDNENIESGDTLKAFIALIYEFMGIGTENEYNEYVDNGSWNSEVNKHYLRTSTLTNEDLTNASILSDGKNYTVILNVKNGNSYNSQNTSSIDSPIDKCGLCVGSENKKYYDHKTSSIIYDAIDETYTSANIQESYSNAKVTGLFDIDTGHLVKLTVDFDIICNIDIGIDKGTLTGTTHIVYKDFRY